MTSTPLCTMRAVPERRLIHPGKCARYMVFDIKVARTPPSTTRHPLILALVLDRSGSMEGPPLQTAKEAAMTIVDQLSEQDQLAVVTFDSEIDVLLAPSFVTAAVREQLREQIHSVEARDSTALHEGWLRGCQAIAPRVDQDPVALGYCFLLTDGQANVGEQDPERIATDARQLRQQGRIGTSTFGFGPRYNEYLLGPMAVAGGGAFHHLSTPGDIVNAFVGELHDLLAVAAPRVRVELALDGGIVPEMVSPFTLTPPSEGTEQPYVIDVGDLLSGANPHIVTRFQFIDAERSFHPEVRARLVWTVDGAEVFGPWESVTFTLASPEECEQEVIDPFAVQYIATERREEGRRIGLRFNQAGNFPMAQRALRLVFDEMQPYVEGNPDEQQKLEDFQYLMAPRLTSFMTPEDAKSMYAESQRQSRRSQDPTDADEEDAAIPPAAAPSDAAVIPDLAEEP